LPQTNNNSSPVDLSDPDFRIRERSSPSPLFSRQNVSPVVDLVSTINCHYKRYPRLLCYPCLGVIVAVASSVCTVHETAIHVVVVVTRTNICKTCRVDGILIFLLDCMLYEVHWRSAVVSSYQHGYPQFSYNLSRSVNIRVVLPPVNAGTYEGLKFEIGYD
jgi:hypothetical protein